MLGGFHGKVNRGKDVRGIDFPEHLGCGLRLDVRKDQKMLLKLSDQISTVAL